MIKEMVYVNKWAKEIFLLDIFEAFVVVVQLIKFWDFLVQFFPFSYLLGLET
jgi:hypothetical protein